MILKVLLIIAVISIVYFMFIKKKPIQKSTNKNDEKLEANDMVECAECGTYAEIHDAIISNNKYYCSNECVGRA